jgi:hypothetical protein
VGSTRVRARRRRPTTPSLGQGMHDAVSRTLGARRRRLVDRPGGGGARNSAKHGGNPARPTVGWYQASLATKKGGAFGTHVKRVRRNGPVEPVRRCVGVRGGGTVARHSTGKGETERKKIEQGRACGTTAAYLQESVPAWHEGRHHTAQARQRDDDQGDPALDSMAELHRGKEGSFLTSVVT